MKHRTGYLHFLILFLLIAAIVKPNMVRAASAPGPVKITKISAVAYNQITLSWKKTSQATDYIIFYKKRTAAKWTKIARVSAGRLSFTHKSSGKYPIIVGQTYDYYVQAYDRKTKASGNFLTGYKRSVHTLPARVPLKSAVWDEKNNSVVISWFKVTGASGYEILRKTSGSWKKIAFVKNTRTSYTDKYFSGSNTNTYTVRAYNKYAKAYGKYDAGGVSIAIEPEQTSLKKLRILFIGNSHTFMNDLPMRVARYARDRGYDCEYTMIARGGWTLQKHMEDPDVYDAIMEGNYDYVVLQDRGHLFRSGIFLDAVLTMDEWIKEAGSRTVLYMAWTMKDDPEKQPAMTKAYKKAAALTNAVWAPVGREWWKYLKAHPNAKFYRSDNHHATAKGTDFAAKIIWKKIFEDIKNGML